MKVQIYVASAEDAAMSAEAGADFVGLVADDQKSSRPPAPNAESLLSFAQARAAFAALPRETMRVALSLETSPQAILAMVDAVAPNVVHLAGSHIAPETVRSIRSAIPTVKIMQAIAMNQPDPVERALEYESVCDYLLLDTKEETQALGIGATGLTHDWSLSAELVKRVSIPVILAGGLSPANVAEAARAVRPWGVDSFTHTNIDGAGVRKDEAKVRAFVANAQSAV